MAWAPIVAAIIQAGGSYLSGRKNKGKDDKIKQTPNYTPEQQEYLKGIISQLTQSNPNAFQYLNNILSDDPEAMEAFNAPAKQEFEEDIIPSILERFSTGGTRHSSGLNQALGRAGQTLATNLNAQRANLKQNAISQLLGYSNLGLGQQNTPYIKEGQQRSPSIWDSLAPTGGKLFGDWLSSQNNSNSNPSPGAVTSSGYNSAQNVNDINSQGFTYG